MVQCTILVRDSVRYVVLPRRHEHFDDVLRPQFVAM